MATVTVRYFAGARAAAGVESEPVEAASLHDLVSAVATRSDRMRAVLSASTFLIDGVSTTDHATALTDGATVDVLPPFAGG